MTWASHVTIESYSHVVTRAIPPDVTFFTAFHPQTALGYPFVSQRSHREQVSPLPTQLRFWLLQKAKSSSNMEAGRRSVLAVPKLGTPCGRDDRKPDQWDLPSLPQAADSIQAVPHIIQYQAIQQRKTWKGFSFPHVQAQSSTRALQKSHWKRTPKSSSQRGLDALTAQELPNCPT